DEKFISLGDKKLYSAKPVSNSSGNLQIAGYYGNMLNLTPLGTFSLEIDPKTGQVPNHGLFPLDRDFRLRFRSTVNRREGESEHFELDHVYANVGSVQLLSEIRYTQTAMVFNPVTGTSSMVNVNHY